ncbi:MAG: threonine transporter RhtB [Brevibacillus sp.]|nr:threonine transporter RhtB [Brevibacillus sp.]
MSVWNGLLFGMLLQLSVGPVCLAILQRSVTFGFRHAWWMIVGVALVDAAYMAGAIGGLALLLQIPLVKQIVVIGGAVVLVWFGVGSIRAKVVQVERVQTAGAVEYAEGVTASSVKHTGISATLVRDSFLYGIVLTLTNPLTILFWAGVFGSLMSSADLADRVNLVGFAVGCVLSTLLFLTAVSALGRYAAKVLHPVWMRRFNFVVGLFLIGFAIVLFCQNVWSF